MTPLSCRLCGAPLHRSFVDLGPTPLANAFVTQEQAAAGVDRAYPLHARVCDACFLVQVEEVVPADSIFSDYPYFSSFATSWVNHARRYAGAMIERFSLRSDSLVMEVASNDGYLLQHFRAAGIPVLGIEPASNIAAAARAIGIPTEETFFNAETAMQIAAQHGRADLVVANNVLAHVPDLFGFAAGFTAILRPNGVATFEFPHLLSLIEGVQFDTIYHEHYSYLSLLVVEHVLRSIGMRVFDVEQLPTHGGSLRVFACHARATFNNRPALKTIRMLESAAGLDRTECYSGFAAKVASVQRNFRKFVAERRESGYRLAAYGAAAKGNTFLNCCGITHQDISCVADRNPTKQGRLLPGSHVPIVSPEALLEAPPDDVVILP
jgi:2-polyprenyl-3-methyl-5-hydroxy-6-metoxy-1,4-benzoquinol methylase